MDEKIHTSPNKKFKFLKTDFQNINYEKRKEFFKESLASDQDGDPCLYLKGDLVWVNVKGSPLWPAMITIPQNETSYTKFRLKKSTKEPVGPRQYHVQFFGDNYRTMWVSCKTIFIYEGLESLISYCEKLKLYVKSCKNANLFAEKNLLKAFSKLSFRTNSSKLNSKSLQWNQAVLEADQVMPFERCERILKFEAPLVNEIMGKNLYKNSVAEENDSKTLISSIDLGSVSPSSPINKGKWNSSSSTNDSVNDFAEDYSMERRKPKCCNSLKKVNQRSEEDLIDSELDIKHEIEIKEETFELSDEYLFHENESMTHQKQTSGNLHEVFSSLKSIGEESVKIEVDNEDMEMKTEFFDYVEDDHELKIEIQGRYIGDENLESKVEENIVNHDSQVDEETLFRRLENSQFPKVVVRRLNIRTEKRSFGAKKQGITKKPKRMTEIFNFPSPISSRLRNGKRNIMELKNEQRKKEGNEIKDIESRKRIKLDAEFDSSLCEYKTSRKGSLKAHLLVHSTEKLFKCFECDYECNYKSDMKRHLLSHSNTKLFKCSECDYECYQKGSLKLHLLTHSNTKLFKCYECDYECNHKGSLKLHLLTHLNTKLFKCCECDYKCNYKSHMKRHLLTHLKES